MPNFILNRAVVLSSLALVAIACGSSDDTTMGVGTPDSGTCFNGVCPGTGGFGNGTGASTGTGGATGGSTGIGGGFGAGPGAGGSLSTTGGTTSTGTGGTVSINCGNGAIDPGEDCDGALLGGATCASATLNALPQGFLSCGANCLFDTSLCSSRNGGGGAGGTGGTSGAGGSGGGVP